MMITNLERDFLSVLAAVEKVTITPKIWNELVSFYPDRYAGKNPSGKLTADVLMAAGSDYFRIIMSYLIFHKVPITIETLCAGYLWGVDELVKNGLEKAPAKVKRVIGIMRHELSPQAAALENRARYG